ncbi:MAG: hypothetical protein HKN26_06335 [Acidimicrobiales bacterium]|nr:hypothetical protein [Acidimicrobiales bacterium]
MTLVRRLLLAGALVASGCAANAESTSAPTTEPAAPPTTGVIEDTPPTTPAPTTTEQSRPNLAFTIPGVNAPLDVLMNGPAAITFSFDADSASFDAAGYVSDGEPRHSFWRIDMDLHPDLDYAFVATGSEATAGDRQCTEWVQNDRGAFVRSPSAHGLPFEKAAQRTDWFAEANRNYPTDVADVYAALGIEVPPYDADDGSTKRTTSLAAEQVDAARDLFPNPGGVGAVPFDRAVLVSYAEANGYVTWLSLELFLDQPAEGIDFTRTLYLTATVAELEMTEIVSEFSLMADTPGCTVYFD